MKAIQDALLNRFKHGNENRFPDLASVISEIGGEWVLNTIFLAMQDYADGEVEILKGHIEELNRSNYLLHEAMRTAEMRGVEKGRAERNEENERTNH